MSAWAGLSLAAVVALGAAPAPRVALRWVAVPGAAAYELEIARDPAFKDVVLREKVPLAGYRWNELPHAPHYWRVRSVDAEGRVGEWSNAERIAAQVSPPEPVPAQQGVVLWPSSQDAGVEVTLAAVPHPLLRAFVFEFSQEASFQKDVRTVRAEAPTAEVRLGREGTWHWRVHAEDVRGQATRPSAAQKLQVQLAPPEVLSPRDGAETVAAAPLSVRWRPHPRARRYRLEVRNEQGRPQVVTVADANADISTDALGARTFRVAAVDADGVAGPFGAPVRVRVLPPPPQVVTPEDGARLRLSSEQDPVALKVLLPEGAVQTRVEVSQTSEFNAPLQSFAFEGEEALLPFPGEGEHFLRAFAVDEGGRVSAASSPVRFAVRVPRPLAQPAWQAPSMDDVLASAEPVSLSWAPVDGAHGYEVAASENTGAAVSRVVEPSSSLSLPDGEHALVVRAVDEDGLPGPWSAPLRFQVGRPAPVRAEWTVARASLVADGRARTELRVRLFDARNREVAPATATFAVSAGKVEAQHVEAGQLRAELVAPSKVPEGGALEVSVEDPAAAVPLRFVVPVVPRPAVVWLGARVGLAHNGGALRGAHVGLEAAWQTPLWQRRLWLSGRVGLQPSQVTLAAPRLASPIELDAQRMPLSLLAQARLPLGVNGWELDVGAGPRVTLLRVALGDQRELGWHLGAAAALGVSRKLGPGRLSWEVGYGLSRARGELAQGSVGGVLTTVGYGVTP